MSPAASVREIILHALRKTDRGFYEGCSSGSHCPGEIDRVRVVRRLPYGLTENGIQAACQINFKPALKVVNQSRCGSTSSTFIVLRTHRSSDRDPPGRTQHSERYRLCEKTETTGLLPAWYFNFNLQRILVRATRDHRLQSHGTSISTYNEILSEQLETTDFQSVVASS
jgi:hypothetical protein